MPLFLDTSGNTTLGIALCGRCSRKRPLDALGIDPNIGPGVLFCRDDGCIDLYDPWRLPARAPDQIALRYVRPDTPLGPAPEVDFGDP
jgi:hypothetical protein